MRHEGLTFSHQQGTFQKKIELPVNGKLYFIGVPVHEVDKYYFKAVE